MVTTRLRDIISQLSENNLRLWGQFPAMPEIFKPRIAKNIKMALSVSVRVICSDDKHYSLSMALDSNKSVDSAFSPDKSILLHEILIIVINTISL